MRRAVLLILGVCILTSTTTPGFSEKPLRLFFEKNIRVEATPGQEHTVKQGEWLFKILEGKGYSGAQIQHVLPEIQALNPHIPDMNHLLPGQVIHFPENTSTPTPAPLVRPSTPLPSEAFKKMTYVVHTGDTLVQILQAQGMPTPLIYSKYLNIFLELNPGIQNGNMLRAGQEVILPVMKQARTAQTPGETALPEPASPGNAQKQSVARPAISGSVQTRPVIAPAPAPVEPPIATQAEVPNAVTDTASNRDNATSPANATQAETKEKRTPRSGLPFIKTVLEQMRFRFVPGDESMFPLPNSGWLHVKMGETPLVETPWGEKVLFCSVPKNAEWIANANKLGMRICSISPHWSLQEILDKLASSFPSHFRLWGAGRELVISRGGISLTLQSPQMSITEHGGKKYIHLIWARQTPDEAALPQGLPEVLEPALVKIIELDHYNELSRLPARPRDSIYVPVATHMDLIRAINPGNPEELFGQTLPDNLSSLLQLLRSKNLLHPNMIQASWSGGSQSRIAVQVPAWTISGSASRIALLDKRFADAYLVSVLAHEGYTCFILPD